MAFKDPNFSYLENHQRRNSDPMIILPLQRYFDEEAMALVLSLFSHLGSHRLVPWCDMHSTLGALDDVFPNLTFSRILLNDNPFSIDDDSILNSLWISEDTGQSGLLDKVAHSIYSDYMHRLLRSMSAPSPTVYAKAAKVCFDILPSLPVPPFSWKRNGVADNNEDDPCPHLIFDGKYFAGSWQFDDEKTGFGNERTWEQLISQYWGILYFSYPDVEGGMISLQPAKSARRCILNSLITPSPFVGDTYTWKSITI
ncbi:hypothetical protein CPC08DRAFT_266664 [Agrocybe pediades]|nr:hypothetical protein CPC08DRAFT_266664 [Agrocybe pediades]